MPTDINSNVMQFPEEVALRVPSMIRWLAMSYSIIILTAIILVNEPAPIVARQTSDEQYIRSDSNESNDCKQIKSSDQKDIETNSED